VTLTLVTVTVATQCNANGNANGYFPNSRIVYTCLCYKKLGS